jgi:hypothetical protein
MYRYKLRLTIFHVYMLPSLSKNLHMYRYILYFHIDFLVFRYYQVKTPYQQNEQPPSPQIIVYKKKERFKMQEELHVHT